MTAAPKFVVRLLVDARSAEQQLKRVSAELEAMAARRAELVAELNGLDSSARSAMATEATLKEQAELGAEAVLGLCEAHGWEVPSLPEPGEWLPGEQPIEHRVRAASVSSQSLPIVQPVPAVPVITRATVVPGDPYCCVCGASTVRVDGVLLHERSQREECHPEEADAAHSEQDGSADL